MKNIKRIIIICIIILLIIPLSISIYLGSKQSTIATEPDIVIMESNNAEKLDLKSINDSSTTMFTYSTIFAALIITGAVYLFVASKKE